MIRTALAALTCAATGMAGAFVYAAPALSLDPAWGVATAGGRVQAARLALARGETRMASRQATLAIDAMPYSQPGLALLAESGATLRPTEALNVAAAMGWRDTLANTRLVQLALIEEKPEIAAQRIDAIGRSEGVRLASPLADLLMARTQGPQALARRAGHRTGSNWWLLYLRRPTADGVIERGKLAFVRALDADDPAWRRKAVEAVIASLRGESAVERGYDLWRDTVADRGAFGAVLYDEAFARLPRGVAALGGDWRTRPDAPFAVEAGRGGGIVLTPLSPAAGTVLAQPVPLPAGGYRFSVTGEGVDARLGWRLQCADGRRLLDSARAAGTWDVDVPDACGMASIDLHAQAGPVGSASSHLRRARLERR